VFIGRNGIKYVYLETGWSGGGNGSLPGKAGLDGHRILLIDGGRTYQ